MNKYLKILVIILIFAACIGLLVYGQRNTGIRGLLLMLLGVAGLLGLLFKYNAGYKR